MLKYMFLYRAIIKDKPLSRWMKYFLLLILTQAEVCYCSLTVLLLGELTTSKYFTDIICVVYTFKSNLKIILKSILKKFWPVCGLKEA